MNQQTQIFIDISEFLTTRITTGIQRVIREFIIRILKDSYVVNIIYYDELLQSFIKIENSEIDAFLKDIKYYQFKFSTQIDIFEMTDKKIFFDIDSVWNAKLKREKIYPKLKEHNFKIYNFIYDLIPILFPNYMHEKSKLNFPDFIKAVYKYSDLVILDSISAQSDFLKLKKDLNILRKIDNDIVCLGSDYAIYQDKLDSKYNELLTKKYILFVGTIEPRKQQSKVLQTFSKLHKKYPDLNLIFIGKIGWHVDKFINQLSNHPLKDKNIFHLTDIEDNLLNLFYKNAFIVTYLSNYEGFGLPVIEALAYNNITIISKNSSLKEIDNQFVDYIEHDLEDTFIKLVSCYIDEPEKFSLRKNYIKKNYKLKTWDDFYLNLIKIMRTGDFKPNDANK